MELWNPHSALVVYDGNQVRYSRGFLRSRPERWFPSFAASWLPLAHSLGLELQCTEIRPVLGELPQLPIRQYGRIGEHTLAIAFDNDSAQLFTNSIAPAAQGAAADTVCEYIVRRFFSTAMMAWSGEGDANAFLIGKQLLSEEPFCGAIKLGISIQGVGGSIWILLSRPIVEQLDGLWRRQDHVQSKDDSSGGTATLEIAYLEVEPTALADYTRPGALIDLEITAGHHVDIRLSGKPWLHAHLGMYGESFVCETAAYASERSSASQLARVSVELGSMPLDAADVLELSQIGSIMDTRIPIGNRVALVVNREVVARGTLGLFEGRWAVAVD
jgi:hypothetical protein